MNRTLIEWVKNPDGTQGYTWNPITGCLNGCEYCYARKLANGRLRSRYLANTNYAIPTGKEMPFLRDIMKEKPIQPDIDPFYPRLWCEKLYEPKHKKGNKGIFVCDMSDLFGIGIPQDWTRYVMVNMVLAPQHRFYLLTKQPQNLIKFSPFPDNCWVGVSVTNPTQLAHAINGLALVEAKVKYYSFEPLPERMIGHTEPIHPNHLADIQWVIIGSQTKPYKPPKIEWVQEIVEACHKAEIPYFLKDNLKKLFIAPDGEIPELRQEMPK